MLSVMAPFVRMLIRNFLALVIAVCAVGYVIPSKIRVEEKIKIDAHRYDLHFLVENLTQWTKWAVWNLEDSGAAPDMGELTRGVGASQSWDNDYGEGTILITRSDVDYGIDYDYTTDSSGRMAKASITYTEMGEEIEVVWTINGKIDVEFLGGYMRILFEQSHKRLLQKSLGNLKEIAEKV